MESISHGTRSVTKARSQKTQAHALIPAGCLSYSKGDDQFPQNAPALIERAAGCYAYDADGQPFLDWGMGLRTVILGHGDPEVLDAVTAQLQKGSNFTRPSPLEAELAALLVDLVPCAEMAKFAKNGSDVTSGAIRLARAYTSREHIVCVGHGSFHSHDDWFIGSTVCRSGVPACVQALTHTVAYNDLPALEHVLQEHAGQVAAVIMEPATTTAPAAGYLQGVRALTEQQEVVLIFDEMITGFRWHLQGAQAYFDVTPDLATFGKAMANGFSLAAIVGRREIMSLGGCDHDREKIYFLSSTHGGETHAIAAALATIGALRDRDVVSHIWNIGAQLQRGFNSIARDVGIDAFVAMEGFPCSPIIVCRDPQQHVSLPFRTLLLQELVARRILIPYIAPSFAHGAREVETTLDATRGALIVYQEALDQGLDGRLIGPAVKPVFRRYNHA